MQTYPGLPPIVELILDEKTGLVNKAREYAQMIVNTFVVIEFVKSFAIKTRKEAGVGPCLKITF